MTLRLHHPQAPAPHFQIPPPRTRPALQVGLAGAQGDVPEGCLPIPLPSPASSSQSRVTATGSITIRTSMLSPARESGLPAAALNRSPPWMVPSSCSCSATICSKTSSPAAGSARPPLTFWTAFTIPAFPPTRERVWPQATAPPANVSHRMRLVFLIGSVTNRHRQQRCSKAQGRRRDSTPASLSVTASTGYTRTQTSEIGWPVTLDFIFTSRRRVRRKSVIEAPTSARSWARTAGS